MLKAVMFDFGNTIMREDSCVDPYLRDCPIDLMPGVRTAIDGIQLPKGIWANTRLAMSADLRRWLERAGLHNQISWVVTSYEIGCRKPAPQFFTHALTACGFQRKDVIFVGNQLDSDIAGANEVGIRCVYLSGEAYRSSDERMSVAAKATFTIATLFELPTLISSLADD
jgi:putative hydrolase of the HAD superfamily